MLNWSNGDRVPEARIERRNLIEFLVDLIAGDEPAWVTIGCLFIPVFTALFILGQLVVWIVR